MGGWRLVSSAIGCDSKGAGSGSAGSGSGGTSGGGTRLLFCGEGDRLLDGREGVGPGNGCNFWSCNLASSGRISSI